MSLKPGVLLLVESTCVRRPDYDSNPAHRRPMKQASLNIEVGSAWHDLY